MKKRFAHIIYTLFLAITLVMPLFPTVATATDADAKLFPSVDQRLIKVLERAQQLQNTVREGENTIGLDRIFFNLSICTGKPIDDIHDDHDNSGVDTGDFVVCEIVSHVTGKPLDEVIEDNDNSLTPLHLIKLYNINEKLILFRFDSLNDAINTEIAGVFPYDLNRFNVNMARYADRLTTTINGLNTRFVGTDFPATADIPSGVEGFIFKRIATETGIQMNVLLDLRAQNAGMPLGEFFARVLIADSLSAGNVFNLNINQDFNIDFSTVTDLTELMRGRQLSPDLLFSRINLLRRELRNVTADDINRDR